LIDDNIKKGLIVLCTGSQSDSVGALFTILMAHGASRYRVSITTGPKGLADIQPGVVLAKPLLFKRIL